jgi:hypothetical protein
MAKKLNRNETLDLLQSKKYWFTRAKNSNKFFSPRVETYLFGVFSRKQIKFFKINKNNDFKNV